MTGHAGLPVPSDVWLADQLAGWIADWDQFCGEVRAGIERSGSLTTDQVWQELQRQSERKTVLLCTARQLFSEVLSRG